jgi:hypothetical protein
VKRKDDFNWIYKNGAVKNKNRFELLLLQPLVGPGLFWSIQQRRNDTRQAFGMEHSFFFNVKTQGHTAPATFFQLCVNLLQVCHTTSHRRHYVNS